MVLENYRVFMFFFFQYSVGENKIVMVWEGGRLIVFFGYVYFIFIVIVLIIMKLFSIYVDVILSFFIDVLL